MPRRDSRAADRLRPVRIGRLPGTAPGRVLIPRATPSCCVPPASSQTFRAWLEGRGKGWITAEYSMLPGSTSPRKPRDRGGKVDGRTTEIQRLIGRSLRAIADLEALGEQMITVDCDVLQADGGTRTLSITGAFVALVDAIRSLTQLPDPSRFPLRDSVSAISVGLVDGQPVLDLPYEEDVAATVDMNVVMTGSGRYVELQGTGEEATFTTDELNQLLALASVGTTELTGFQRVALGSAWPFAA